MGRTARSTVIAVLHTLSEVSPMQLIVVTSS